MYFPLLKPHGQGKRSAAQPKAIDSALPKVSAGHFLPGCAGSAFRFPDGESCKNPGANAPGFFMVTQHALYPNTRMLPE